jgi:hypothetical protein
MDTSRTRRWDPMRPKKHDVEASTQDAGHDKKTQGHPLGVSSQGALANRFDQ